MEPQKRKNEEEIESVESKKPHQEVEFTKSQISAESTLISNMSETDSLSNILEEVEKDTEGEYEEIEKSAKENIVTVIKEKDENTTSLKEEVALLHKELFEKSKEIIILRQENINLLSKVQQLETDKMSLENENNDKNHKIRRYTNAIVKIYSNLISLCIHN